MKVIHICFSCSMLCTDGLMLYLVGKGRLLVYPEAPYRNFFCIPTLVSSTDRQ